MMNDKWWDLWDSAHLKDYFENNLSNDKFSSPNYLYPPEYIMYILIKNQKQKILLFKRKEQYLQQKNMKDNNIRSGQTQNFESTMKRIKTPNGERKYSSFSAENLSSPNNNSYFYKVNKDTMIEILNQDSPLKSLQQNTQMDSQKKINQSKILQEKFMAIINLFIAKMKNLNKVNRKTLNDFSQKNEFNKSQEWFFSQELEIERMNCLQNSLNEFSLQITQYTTDKKQYINLQKDLLILREKEKNIPKTLRKVSSLEEEEKLDFLKGSNPLTFSETNQIKHIIEMPIQQNVFSQTNCLNTSSSDQQLGEIANSNDYKNTQIVERDQVQHRKSFQKDTQADTNQTNDEKKELFVGYQEQNRSKEIIQRQNSKGISSKMNDSNKPLPDQWNDDIFIGNLNQPKNTQILVPSESILQNKQYKRSYQQKDKIIDTTHINDGKDKSDVGGWTQTTQSQNKYKQSQQSNSLFQQKKKINDEKEKSNVGGQIQTSQSSNTNQQSHSSSQQNKKINDGKDKSDVGRQIQTSQSSNTNQQSQQSNSSFQQNNKQQIKETQSFTPQNDISSEDVTIESNVNIKSKNKKGKQQNTKKKQQSIKNPFQNQQQQDQQNVKIFESEMNLANQQKQIQQDIPQIKPNQNSDQQKQIQQDIPQIKPDQHSDQYKQIQQDIPQIKHDQFSIQIQLEEAGQFFLKKGKKVKVNLIGFVQKHPSENSQIIEINQYIIFEDIKQMYFQTIKIDPKYQKNLLLILVVEMKDNKQIYLMLINIPYIQQNTPQNQQEIINHLTKDYLSWYLSYKGSLSHKIKINKVPSF